MSMRSLILLASTLFSITSFATDLTPTQKQFIAWGETCCYSAETIEDVLAQQAIVTFQPYVILDLPPLKEPATRLSWVLFYTLQVLDVYSTVRAVDYSCVKEVNPLLSESPSATDLVALKVFLLAPALWYTNKYETITDEDLAGTNYIMTAVVANNFDIYYKAKKRDDCIKIR